MTQNICNICGANYEYRNGRWKCPACGAYKAEELSNEEVTLFYNAAQKLRLCDFDDAEKAYSDIIEKFPKNANGYWGRLLSHYGIKYEEDFDGRKIPTCYATAIESVMFDKDYVKAISLADVDTKVYFEQQAQYIERVRKEWIERAKKEKPYDIFICYKDSDLANGIDRTKDSIAAQDLYIHLTEQGYRVFFSRESLRDKVGERYEPYIFNALSTAKVMLVYGSSAEYITSTWLKNEWTRYEKRLQDGEKKPNSLIVACDGFSPSELPKTLSSMQCFDATKRSFYTDLDIILKRIIKGEEKPKPVTNVKNEKKKSKKIPIAIASVSMVIALLLCVLLPNFLGDKPTKTIIDSKYGVVITAQDEIFDKNTSIIVDRLSEGTQYTSLLSAVNNEKSIELQNAIIYDIECDVDISKNVTVKVGYGKQFSNTTVKVYYVSDDKTIIEEHSCIYDNGAVEFKTNHLSYYVIGELVTSADNPGGDEPIEPSLTVKEGILQVGVCADNEPYEYIENGEFKGIEIDILKALAEELELTVEFKNYLFEDLLTNLTEKKIDCIIGVTQTVARDEIANASNTLFSEEDIDYIIYVDKNSAILYDAVNVAIESLKSNGVIATIISQYSAVVNDNETKYNTAVSFIDAGKYEEAYALLKEIQGYSNSAELLERIVFLPSVKTAVADSEQIYQVRYQYDTNGYLLKETQNYDGHYIWYYYTYDQDGCKIKQRCENEGVGTWELNYEYEYDSNGRISKEIWRDEENNVTTVTYTYNSSGNVLKKVISYDDGSVDNYTYTYNANGTVDTMSYDSSDYYTMSESTKYEYNSDGLLIKETTTHSNLGVYVLEYIYNDNGVLESTKGTSAEGLVNIISYEYEWFYFEDTQVEPSDKVTISFDANGGTGNVPSITVERNEYIDMPTNSFVREGYTFVGWSSTSEGVEWEYPEGAKCKATASKTYYARWSANTSTPKTHTATFKINGTTVATRTFSEGDNELDLPSIPEKQCHRGEWESYVLGGTDIIINGYYYPQHTNLEHRSASSNEDCLLVGNIEHWYCFACDKYYLDSEGVSETTEVYFEAGCNFENGSCTRCHGTEGIIYSNNEDGTYSVNSLESDCVATHIVIPEKYDGKNVTGIDSFAFCGTQIESIMFKGQISSIGNGAFQACTNLKNISLVNCSITVLNEQMFYECHALETVELPNTIITIGKSAFADCKKLKEISIPTSVEIIENNAFMYCEALINVHIPDKVETIGECAFCFCKNLNTVNLGNGVQYLKANAFSDCENLTTVIFGQNIREIGEATFARCPKLKTITLPNVVEKIGSQAFFACWALESVFIPSSVIYVGDSCFVGCESAIISCDFTSQPNDWDVNWNEDGGTVKWLGENSYTIEYHLNGGVNNPNNPYIYTNTEPDIVLLEPSKDGFTFKGWYLDPNFNTSCSAIPKGSTGNKSFYADWIANENTICFNANGGVGTMVSVKGKTDSTITLPQNVFTRRGYEFVGWATISNGSVQYQDEATYSVGTKETYTLYAIWDIIEYSISYDSNGGVLISPKTEYTVNSNTFSLVVPERDGYVFLGWSGTDVSGVQRTVTISKGSIGDRSYTANWEAHTYSITLDVCGGTLQCDENQTVTFGSDYNIVPPIRSGYSFGGWFADPDGITPYTDENGDSLNAWTIPRNETFYAKWTANTNTAYTVKHYQQNVDNDGYTLKDTETLYGTTGTTVAPDTKTYMGFNAPSKASVKILGDGTAVLEYYYIRTSCTITFVTNGGEAIDEMIVKYQQTLELPIATREGFTFGGWFTDVALSEEFAATTISSNTTLYAWWAEENKPSDFTYSGTLQVTITSYIGSKTEMYIPSYIGGQMVTGIAQAAFSNRTRLVSATIPDTVNRIGMYAFSGCFSLEELSIPFIGQNEEAKNNGAVLGYLFGHSFRELSITLEGYADGEFINDDFGYSWGENIWQYSYKKHSTGSNYKIFVCYYGIPKSLRTVKITNQTSISVAAFNNCSFIETIVISEKTEEICEYAFNNCSSLAKICFEGTVEQWKNIQKETMWNNGMTEYVIACSDGNVSCYSEGLKYLLSADKKSYIVSGIGTCEDTNLVIPSSYNNKPVVSIGSGAFVDNDSIVSVVIPDSVTIIESYAFAECSSLSNVVLPNTILKLGDSAFMACSSISDIVIPDSLEEIGGHCFSSCTSLKSVELTNVRIIGGYAFCECANLTSIILSDNAMSIGEDVFYGCIGLTTLVVPYGSINLDNYQFTGCVNLTSVYCLELIGGNYKIKDYKGTTTELEIISNHNNKQITSIGYMAFGGEKNLATIVLPDTITNLDAGALYCESLETVMLSSKLTVINAAMFNGCANLKSVYLYNSITKIDFDVFYNCKNLKEIYYSGTIAEWNAIEKGSEWDAYTGEYTIFCSDGNIVK